MIAVYYILYLICFIDFVMFLVNIAHVLNDAYHT